MTAAPRVAASAPLTFPSSSGGSPGTALQADGAVADAAAPERTLLERAVEDLSAATLEACRAKLPFGVSSDVEGVAARSTSPTLQALERVVEAARAAGPGPEAAEEWLDTGLLRAVRESAIPGGRSERLVILAALDALIDLAPNDALAADAAALAMRLAEPEAERDVPVVRIQGWLERVRVLRSNPATGLVETLVARNRAIGLGVLAPRFIARDTDGNEVDSDRLRGKIVVMRYWSHSSPASIAAHETDLSILRQRWNEPIELVGVTRHADRAEHLAWLDELHFGGIQIFEGPISVELSDALARNTDVLPNVASPGSTEAAVPGPTDAFVHPRPGALVVLDAEGRVRGRDLSHGELDALLFELVAERRAQLRDRIVTAHSSPSGSNR